LLQISDIFTGLTGELQTSFSTKWITVNWNDIHVC